jgi:hypothetical protein
MGRDKEGRTEIREMTASDPIADIPALIWKTQKLSFLGCRQQQCVPFSVEGRPPASKAAVLSGG